MPYSPPDHLTVHLTRAGDDWRVTVVAIALGDQDRPAFQRALLAVARDDVVFGPRESAGEVLEELGQAIDRLDAARRIEEVRAADGAGLVEHLAGPSPGPGPEREEWNR